MAEQVRVFVSYTGADLTFADKLAHDLVRAGAEVWAANITTSVIGQVEAKINQGLRGRDFLILVLTPDALQSPWVQEEVHAAKELVRKNRMRDVIFIMPRPVEDDDIPPTWATLRRFDATTDYRGELGKLLGAMGLDDVDDVDKSAPPVEDGADRALAPGPSVLVPATISNPLVLPRDDADLARGQVVFTSGPPPVAIGVRIVDADSGPHRTIMDAVRTALPGERIVVRPGIYRETLLLEKSLALEGSGARDDVVIEARGDNAITCRGDRISISHLTIRVVGQRAPGGSNAVLACQGAVAIEDCELSARRSAAVFALGECDLTVRECIIHGTDDTAIYVCGDARATVEDNRLGPSITSGVWAADDSHVTARANTVIISDPVSAFKATERARCTTQDNVVHADGRGAEPRAISIPKPRQLQE